MEQNNDWEAPSIFILFCYLKKMWNRSTATTSVGDCSKQFTCQSFSRRLQIRRSPFPVHLHPPCAFFQIIYHVNSFAKLPPPVAKKKTGEKGKNKKCFSQKSKKINRNSCNLTDRERFNCVMVRKNLSFELETPCFTSRVAEAFSHVSFLPEFVCSKYLCPRFLFLILNQTSRVSVVFSR